MKDLSVLSQYYDVPQKVLDLLGGKLKPCRYSKGQSIVNPGNVQQKLHFVKSGVQMSYLESENKLHVMAFTYPPDITAIPDSFFFQKPSEYYLECITDTQTESITYSELQDLFNQVPILERAFRKMTESVLSGVIQRHADLQMLDMKERYLKFCKRSPHLLNIVPHKYIASYLAIDPTNFSKLYNSIVF